MPERSRKSFARLRISRCSACSTWVSVRARRQDDVWRRTRRRAPCVSIESQEKLDAAANVLDARAELRRGRFQDRLPEGPFELIVSAFALHHVDGAVRADLFPRVAERLSEGGRFVVADVVEPQAPVSEPTPLDRAHSVVSRTDALLHDLRQAGFQPGVWWAEHDLVVIAASVCSPAQRVSR